MIEWQRRYRRCARLVTEITRAVRRPDPDDMDGFVDALSRYRKRELLVCEIEAARWTSYDDHDLIAYPADASPSRQHHLIGHGLGHLLLGHVRQCVLSVPERASAAPSLARAGSRDRFDADEHSGDEREAELFATLLLTRPRRGGAPHSDGSPHHHLPLSPDDPVNPFDTGLPPSRPPGLARTGEG